MFGQKHILRLDVSVQNLPVMHVLEAQTKLNKECEDLVLRQRFLGQFPFLKIVA